MPPRDDDDRNDRLQRYRAKRNFASTSEPADAGIPNESQPRFVIQKHWAHRLHYDFRLELGGTLKSWAVPKGPSLDPKDKRMAVQVEDHPLSYADFEGDISEGNYGAGHVIVWDRGHWQPRGDPLEAYENGKLGFELHGEKLSGGWALVRMHGRGNERQPSWLLIKEKDTAARAAADYSVVDALPDSVLGGVQEPQPAQAGKAKSADATKKIAKNDDATTAKRRKTSKSTVPDRAREAELPETLKPQLATLAAEPPQGDAADWLYELKFDGYRLLARVEHGHARLFTRNAQDWTERMPQLARAVEALPLDSGWLDGEVVLPRAGDEVPDFQALQNAFDGAEAAERLIWHLFDLPFAQGRDLRELPLVERRAMLAALVDAAPADVVNAKLRLSEELDGQPKRLLESACARGFEGVIGKRRDSVYVSRRSSDWIKLKCALRQEFVIGGYTDPQGARVGIGALLLGVHDDDGTLRWAGNVGTGFTHASLLELQKRLARIETAHSPFADSRSIRVKGRHWVEPKLLAEVSFAEWTGAGRIRHAVFHGLREDKKPRAITREKPASPAARKPARDTGAPPSPASVRAEADGATLPEKFKVSHPDRVIDPSCGATKLDLIAYYARVAALMLPHLAGRPVALLRAPRGVTGGKFFQKHAADAQRIAGVAKIDASIDARLDPGDGALLEIESAEGLLNLAQLNTVELHTWNATSHSIARPDRLSFDLDPGSGIGFEQVREGALLVRSVLDELGLAVFLKTSGGKGLHLIVPIRPQHDWDSVLAFAKGVVEHLARVVPARFVALSGEKNRVGKIFVDYLRNGFGATTVATWSARARPGLGVSVPIGWDELDRIESGAQFTIRTIDDARLALGNAPWRDYEAGRRALSSAIRKLAGAARR